MVASRRFVPGWVFPMAACLVGVGPATLLADETIAFARVTPLFQKHCYGCHASAKAKGKLRIDKLNPDFVKGNDGDHWRDVLDRLNFGDMPPASEPALKKEDRDLMTAWVDQSRPSAGAGSPPAKKG